MSDQIKDAVANLRDWPQLQFRPAHPRSFVWYEDDTITRESLPIFSTQSLPEKYQHGAQHPKWTYLTLIDIVLVGADDHHWNIRLVYRIDLQKVDDFEWPKDLADNDVTIVHPHFDSTRAIKWELVVLNPDEYERGATATPHPTITDALLINESHSRDGTVLIVNREYQELAPEASQRKWTYGVAYECEKGAAQADRYPIVTLTLEVQLSTFNPTSWSTCPIDGTSAIDPVNAHLDFTGLVLGEAPRMTPLNPVFGKVTLVYRKLPGLTLTDHVWRPGPNLIDQRTRRAVVTGTAGSPMSANGSITEIQAVNCHYSIATTRKASPFSSRTYTTSVDFYWPAVLGGVELMDWLRLDGESDNYPRLIWSKYPYHGPCRATVVESWSLTPVSAPTITKMQPNGIDYASPKWTLHIPACLHGSVQLYCNTGNNDPFYDVNSGSARTFPATNFQTWPGSIIGDFRQYPYAGGGFISRQITVSSPST